MSAVLLDTSAYSAMRRGDKEIADAIRQASLIVVSPILVAELLYGYINGIKESENRDVLDDFLAEPYVLFVDVDMDTAERYAIIMRTLRSQGTPIPTNDIWTAALAWQHGYRILTRDKHFQNIPQVITV